MEARIRNPRRFPDAGEAAAAGSVRRRHAREGPAGRRTGDCKGSPDWRQLSPSDSMPVGGDVLLQR